LPPDQFQSRPESQLVRSLYDCPEVPVGPAGVLCRVVVATHPADTKKSPVGLTRAGVVYELFFTTLPQQAFTASDVVELYLHRGAFEPALADEDQEIDPDRWCSHTACGQEAWCIVSQWVWNLRLELGHQLEPTPLRTTELAPAQAEANAQRPVTCGYGKPTVAVPWKAGRFSGQDFALQPDGTLRCPANQTRIAHTNGARKPMGVCAWSMPPASAVVVPGRMPRAVSMAWQRYREAPPGQRTPASARRRLCPATLARLEPESAPTRLSATRATPTHRGEPAVFCRRFTK